MDVESQRARNNQLVAAKVIGDVDEERVEAVGELMSTVFVGWSSSKDLVILKSKNANFFRSPTAIVFSSDGFTSKCTN